jgi:hypothetical protein
LRRPAQTAPGKSNDADDDQNNPDDAQRSHRLESTADAGLESAG